MMGSDHKSPNKTRARVKKFEDNLILDGDVVLARAHRRPQNVADVGRNN